MINSSAVSEDFANQISQACKCDMNALAHSSHAVHSTVRSGTQWVSDAYGHSFLCTGSFDADGLLHGPNGTRTEKMELGPDLDPMEEVRTGTWEHGRQI